MMAMKFSEGCNHKVERLFEKVASWYIRGGELTAEESMRLRREIDEITKILATDCHIKGEINLSHETPTSVGSVSVRWPEK